MNAANNPDEWIRLAGMDLATAHHMFETYYPRPLEIVCFHSQQAAEKMLKCFLVSRDVEPPKTHDLQVLCDMCLELEARFDKIYTESVSLARYGVIPRCPAEFGIIEDDAEKAIECADAVMSFVKAVLREETGGAGS